ncbi:molybdenum cofactor synthesis protein cinnamon [Arctopsyche grandis]|uniref:molybdenum cofactor synthesis protein cinnamon n=1 Tax=Arctopsyche grandis TaxID=121162 RepID=UPI00406D779E
MDDKKFVIITVSDTCSSGTNEDKSGPFLVSSLEQDFPNSSIQSHIVPDDEETISKSLIYNCDVIKASLILTTGGTGFAQRDVTPEATRKVIQRRANGIETAILMESLKVTQMAMMSRLVSGIRKSTLIINFPGSLKAVRECYAIVRTIIPHSIELLSDSKDCIKRTHDMIQGSVNSCNHHKPNTSDKARVRESPYPMIEVAQAMNSISNVLKQHSVWSTTTVPVINSLGLIAAEDIVAKEPFPPFEASIKDGYACWMEDGKGPRKVCGDVAAGDSPSGSLKRGECVFINTGAPIPMHANCVVQIEDTKVFNKTADGVETDIEILVEPKLGQDIRQIGSDIKKDEIVVCRGTCIGPVEMGLLATVGVSLLKVYLKPSIGILSTGNELQPFTTANLETGHIRDSNKIMLMNLLSKYNIKCTDLGIVHDESTAIVETLNHAFQISDILITTGSVSMGDRDLLKPILLKEFNADIVFGRLNMRPGKPSTFATCMYQKRRKYIFALPGNPVSAFVTCNLLVVPALMYWMGHDKYELTRINVELDEDVPLDPRPHYARAMMRYSKERVCPTATITGNQISSRLMNSSGANILIELPSSKEAAFLLKGTIVSAILLN